MRAWLLAFFLLASCATAKKNSGDPAPDTSLKGNGFLVLTTDFGTRDGAVSEMKGVAYGVSPRLVISDLTHEIPPYNIWEAAYRLQQTYKYWPAGTVFVTVVDPGVGSARQSLMIKTKSGHYFIGPDNGHLTLVMDEAGVEAGVIMDESLMRRRGSEESYTFHGRDLYVYAGARLASGELDFLSAGKATSAPLVRLNYQTAEAAGGKIEGMIPVLDPNYGNVWSNIPKSMVTSTFGASKSLHVTIRHKGKSVYSARLPVADTFAGVAEGKPLLYFNSLLNLSLALNMDNFARKNKIGSGPDWRITVSK